ncbi:DUF397 domain-containing protein [Streptosporangium sp. NPDC002544]|uniref:DUF397 domain-containing protein n=1 Tax=Streptosporangium sp. NPDC002544 TaxID=3154538 RepID=UPI00332C46A3
MRWPPLSHLYARPYRFRCVRTHPTSHSAAGVLPGGGQAVRDGKNPNGPALNFSPAEWRAFIGSVKNHGFDR